MLPIALAFLFTPIKSQKADMKGIPFRPAFVSNINIVFSKFSNLFQQMIQLPLLDNYLQTYLKILFYGITDQQ